MEKKLKLVEVKEQRGDVLETPQFGCVSDHMRTLRLIGWLSDLIMICVQAHQEPQQGPRRISSADLTEAAASGPRPARSAGRQRARSETRSGRE